MGLEPVCLVIKRGRLRWFRHVERKVDGDWVKRCMLMEIGGIRQRGRPEKDLVGLCQDDMRSFGLTREVSQDKAEWRARIKGALG